MRIGAKEVLGQVSQVVEGQRALKEEDQICGHKLAEMIKKHSTEAFYFFDDPPEAAIFSMLIELMKELEKAIWIFDI